MFVPGLISFSRYRFETLDGYGVEFIVYGREGRYYNIRYWNGLKSKIGVSSATARECVETTWRASERHVERMRKKHLLPA